MQPRTCRNVTARQSVKVPTPARRGRAARRAPLIALALAVGILPLVFAAGMAPRLYAQAYPEKPIRFILPQSPGGVHDILGRMIAQKLGEQLGQTVICDNRGGSGGNVGTELAAKARPDGYTILLVSSALAYSPSLYKKLNYNPIRDLAPITLVAEVPVAVLVNAAKPFKTLGELVAFARANPGKLNFGSGGVGSANHLHVELFKNLTKIDIVNVPYKGAGPALTGLMGGEIDLMMTAVSSSLPHIQAGKLRALAVMSRERLPSLPAVPTAQEAGVENFLVSTWYGVLAPVGTPAAVVSRLNQAWNRIVKMPDTLAVMQKSGLEPLSGTPEQFSTFLKAEIAAWSAIIKEANISID